MGNHGLFLWIWENNGEELKIHGGLTTEGIWVYNGKSHLEMDDLVEYSWNIWGFNDA